MCVWSRVNFKVDHFQDPFWIPDVEYLCSRLLCSAVFLFIPPELVIVSFLSRTKITNHRFAAHSPQSRSYPSIFYSFAFQLAAPIHCPSHAAHSPRCQTIFASAPPSLCHRQTSRILPLSNIIWGLFLPRTLPIASLWHYLSNSKTTVIVISQFGSSCCKTTLSLFLHITFAKIQRMQGISAILPVIANRLSISSESFLHSIFQYLLIDHIRRCLAFSLEWALKRSSIPSLTPSASFLRSSFSTSNRSVLPADFIVSTKLLLLLLLPSETVLVFVVFAALVLRNLSTWIVNCHRIALAGELSVRINFDFTEKIT